MPGSEAHPRKVRFGAYELDEAARELRKNGLSIHLQDQPWEVLRALLERPGEVVSREDLRRRLWPDGTYVDYEQSLNKAVNKLREALCDSADKPRYVETVSRRGYRFVAAVEPDHPKVEEPNGPPGEIGKLARSRSRLWWGAGAPILLAAVLVTGLWPIRAPRTRVTQLTNGGRTNFHFLAVHGGRILYTAQAPAPNRNATQFWSVSTEGGEPRLERMPFMKPDYGALLFQVNAQQGVILIRASAADSARGELWLAGFDGSKPRRIGDTIATNGYAVSPDLKTLLRASKEGLFVSPVDGGPERLVTRIDWKGPSYTFWHPSGERIVFWPLKDGPLRVWEVRLDGTGMQPLLPKFAGEQDNVNWSPGGKRLYFTSRGELYVRRSRTWLSWMRSPEPERLTAGSVRYSIAIEDPTDPSRIFTTGVGSRGESMKLNKRTNVFEPYLDGLSAEGFSYSSDGQWVAYVTYPARGLWKCRLDGSDKVLLEDGLRAMMPRWSPDGKRIAFAAARRGIIEPHRIYTIAAEGGGAELVKGVNGPGFDPNWSPDGKKLVFAPLEYEFVPVQQRHISVVDLDTGEVQMVPGSENVFSPRWSPDGRRLMALRSDQVQPVIYDFETRQWTDVDAKVFGFPAWSKDSRYVYGLLQGPDKLVRIEVATRKVEEIRSVKEFRLAGNIGYGVSWTPEGEAVVLQDLSTREIYRIDVER